MAPKRTSRGRTGVSAAADEVAAARGDAEGAEGGMALGVSGMMMAFRTDTGLSEVWR